MGHRSGGHRGRGHRSRGGGGRVLHAKSIDDTKKLVPPCSNNHASNIALIGLIGIDRRPHALSSLVRIDRTGALHFLADACFARCRMRPGCCRALFHQFSIGPVFYFALIFGTCCANDCPVTTFWIVYPLVGLAVGGLCNPARRRISSRYWLLTCG
jgi:hypothetical protein